MNEVSKEKLAELQLAHPNKRLKVIEYTFDDEQFELVATIPTRTQLQRSLAESKVSDEQGAASIALDCIVYPDVDTLLEERFLSMMSVAEELLRLGGAGAKACQKKPQNASSTHG